MLPTTQRMEAFTDAVIAIAITLLVFGLKPPHFVANDFDSSWEALRAVRPHIYSFIFSFVVIAVFWVNHHQFFTELVGSSRRLLWTNIFFTFWICIIPFPTELLGTNPHNPVAVMIYGFVLFMGALSFSLMQLLCQNLIKPKYSAEARRQHILRSLPAPILYAISVLAAPLSLSIAYGIFILVPMLYFLPRRMAAGHMSELENFKTVKVKTILGRR